MLRWWHRSCDLFDEEKAKCSTTKSRHQTRRTLSPHRIPPEHPHWYTKTRDEAEGCRSA